MVRTNKDRVVKGAVIGEIRPTCCRGYTVGQSGEAIVVPGIGGITYNVQLGDSVYGWACDHVEPGVSIYNKDQKDSDSLNFLACVGNQAKIIEGDAKGKIGYVLGHHGGAENVIIHFDPAILDDLCIGEKIQVKAWGQGLEMTDYPDIIVHCVDPDLFDKLGIEENGDGTITVPVTATVPPYLMGSGLGATNRKGDYDIMTADRDAIREFGLDKLRFGDLVLLQDCDNNYGRGYLKGAVSIGVVIHSDCVLAGHGPGITTIMSTNKPIIKAKIDENANIGKILGII